MGAAPPPSARHAELTDFLRTRRAQVTPEQVGLEANGRRRTPGLRREDVAHLAGVGLSWYTWLEQGRDINASPSVLDAIAHALRLSAAERDTLYALARVFLVRERGAAHQRALAGAGSASCSASVLVRSSCALAKHAALTSAATLRPG